MRVLSFLIFNIILLWFGQQSNSPHGKNFNVSCNVCHSPRSWDLDKSVYSFNHGKTKFPLTGQHNNVKCRECHTSLIFTEAGTECNECHQDIHQATAGKECNRCHTTTSWLVNSITQIHDRSRFPLLGAHRMAECATCHKSENFVRFDVPGVDCIDCHRADYLSATNPNHVQSGMSEDCSLCHKINSTVWSQDNFDHSSFPLAQGHGSVRCTQCHTTGRYTDAKPECYSCHQSDFVSAKSPDHVSAQFETNCSLCHTLVAGWKPAAFDHSAFPLTLGHSAITCTQCHTGGNYTSLPSDCYSCHQSDFTATTNPNHLSAGFSTDCKTCHTTNPGWKPTSFNHNIFPLTLGHSGLTCTQCHTGGNYSSAPTDCYACHSSDYLATTNPNHTSQGFPQTCQVCHTTNPSWTPASYNHSSFPLTLGHSGVSCTSCHIGGNYNSTSSVCYNCHTSDYNSTTDPNHQSLGFSTTCTQCHTTNPGWQPASYSAHDSQYFPIYSGRHQGVWSKCSDCHTDAGSYTTFNCIVCHADAHRGQNYTNAQCYSCHPRGTEDK